MVESPHVLITGGTGRLGRELVKCFPESLHPTRVLLDLSKREVVERYIEEHTFEVVIHAAALVGIRECEDDRLLAWGVNVDGTQNLVRACEAFHASTYFVYISSACVFYGDRGNYTEDDLPYPKNFYGVTKLLGESALRFSRLKRWLVIRTNFASRDPWRYPRAFVDRYGTYLFADDTAEAIKEIVAAKNSGIIHVCGDRKMSMFELARLTTPDVDPMTMAEYSGPPLTVNMTLKSKRVSPFKIRQSIVS